ncbi:MAG: hypothetical protein V7K72_15405 [Nostoc sp.]
MTPRVFAPINTVIGILFYFILVWLNEGSLEWSGNPFGGWKTAIIFLAGGAITGGVTGKALESERKWYEEHGDDDFDYEFNDEDE